MVKKVIGLVIIIVGLSLLLSNLEIVSFDDISGIVLSAGIMVVGIVGLLERRRFDFFLSMFVIFGGLYLLTNVGVLDEDFMDLVVGPIVIVAIGVTFLFSVTRRIGSTKSETSYTAVFSGAKEKNESIDYISSEVTAVFGGVEADYRKIKIKGNQGYINVTAVFGGATIFVPEDVKVTVKGLPMFGGANNKAISNSAAKKELVINYTAIFGGVEIKN